MTKSETTILESKTPEEYIDRSLKTKLGPAAKAHLARMWMESTGYTKEDILRARNRHPYWKRKKMEGSAERTRRRLAAHDYSGGSTVQWSSELVSEFLGLNSKDAAGRYQWKDWQLAERFGATIPSIQYMRRKLRKVQLLLGPRAPSPKVVEYLLRAESVLSRGKAAVEELRAKSKAVKPPKAKPIPSKAAPPKTAAKSSAPGKPASGKAAVPRKARGARGSAPAKRATKSLHRASPQRTAASKSRVSKKK